MEPAYDTLTDRELEIANQPETPEEVQCLAFNKSIPRGKQRLFHTVVWYYSIFEFSRKELGHYAKCFSDQTTGLWSAYRFYHLYRVIRKMKPETVLEFGSGVSTVFIAEVLRLNEIDFNVKGRVISFEQSESYYDSLIKNFPESLKEFVEIKLSLVRLKWCNQYRGIYYDIKQEEIPKSIDLVYIDGATRTRGDQKSNFPYRRLNADIVNLVKWGFEIKYAITDHRYANLPFYQSELGHSFDVRLVKRWRSIELKRKSSLRKPEMPSR